jgi:hypothetical protein
MFWHFVCSSENETKSGAMRSRKVLDREVGIQISKLRVAPWHKDLFVFERDCTSLRSSFGEHGFKREYPVVVRQPNQQKEDYEIICGYQRVKIAEEFHLERVPAVVKDLDAEGARRYAVEDNLSPARIFAPITPVHAIVLSRDLEKHGGKYRVDKILELTNIEKPTYKRVVTSLNYALSFIYNRYPEFSELDEPALIAESIRRNLWPEFSNFCNGKMPPYTFYCTYYLASETSRERSKKQREYRGLSAKQESIEQANITSIKSIESSPSQNWTAALRGILELACQVPKEFISNKTMSQLSKEQLEILESYAEKKEKIATVLKAIIGYCNQSKHEELLLSREKISSSITGKSLARGKTRNSTEAPTSLLLFQLKDNE